MALAGLVAAGLALTAQRPAAAGSRGVVVIRGTHSGSHLKLTVRNGRIHVRGRMAAWSSRGCRRARRGPGAVCPARRPDRVVIVMGPKGDKVEVRDKLPAPLTIYLGPGSDKFIGNGERDTCYPGGSRRNRCVGGGGDDVCITGPRNSDCVGGPGDDYCRHGTGSDGCWGGPGNDICVMGPGHDGCHGGPGNDRLYGGPASDQLYGGPGHDYCDGGPGRGKSHGCEAGPRH